MSAEGLSRGKIALMVATLALGLALDIYTALPGQLAIGAAVFLVLWYVMRAVHRQEQLALVACLVIATAGELFLSLVWGLYTYRLDNVPAFVPPGHVLMLMLGLALARQMSAFAADAVLAGAALYAVGAAVSGVDTLAIPLCVALAIIRCAMPHQRRLYASTFVLALVLELYGTWLGNWTWAHRVPVVPLVTTNPPAVAGAFYAVLDALVAVTALVATRHLARRAARIPPLLCSDDERAPAAALVRD
jgi:hypothetical protein